MHFSSQCGQAEGTILLFGRKFFLFWSCIYLLILLEKFACNIRIIYYFIYFKYLLLNSCNFSFCPCLCLSQCVSLFMCMCINVWLSASLYVNVIQMLMYTVPKQWGLIVSWVSFSLKYGRKKSIMSTLKNYKPAKRNWSSIQLSVTSPHNTYRTDLRKWQYWMVSHINNANASWHAQNMLHNLRTCIISKQK